MEPILEEVEAGQYQRKITNTSGYMGEYQFSYAGSYNEKLIYRYIRWYVYYRLSEKPIIKKVILQILFLLFRVFICEIIYTHQEQV